MILVCAWCGNKLKASRAGCKGGTSYGICLPCASRVLKDSPWLLKEYVDQIDSPVALVSGEGVVMTANRLACALLQKELAQIEGVECGKVFGCEKQEEDNGCGEGPQCAGCEIKRCVSHTHRTGKGVTGIPTHLGQHPSEQDAPWWLISTSKFLDCVVLKICGIADMKEGPKKMPRRREKGVRLACGTP
ncbi:hypothetical protein LPW11_03255 [Geomonas sp. RF6]|uniref:hypothetical protein n=1 Tax=Geomonas sp. RF6 TaxID=2897342 RepID=UPI001E4683B1|nr:hypothetical protein [Geomonas sp. RF6]UFS71216.1 hypothetical protein LPW11_03255 [Geomonas sp. RF6]